MPGFNVQRLLLPCPAPLSPAPVHARVQPCAAGAGSPITQYTYAMPECPPSICPVIWTLVLGGLLGGFVNILRERRLPVPERDPAQKPWIALILTCLLPLLQGLAAAGVVPLFLSLTKSTLLKDAMTASADRAVLFGLAVVASVSAKSFLDSITKRALQDIEANKKAIADTKDKVEKIEDEIDEGEGSKDDKSGDAKSLIADQAPALSQDEQNILNAMRDSKWFKRTASGVERDLETKPDNLIGILDGLTAKGLLIRHEPTPTQENVRWSLSAAGKRATQKK